MVVHAVVLVASFCCVAFLPDVNSPSILLLSGAVLSACMVIGFYSSTKYRSLITLLIIFCGGVLYASLYATYQLSQRLPPEMLGVETRLTGTVVGLPRYSGRRLRFLCKVETLQKMGADAPLVRGGKLRLDWYGTDIPNLKAGDKVDIVVKLKAPSGFMNPGGYDLERWLTQKKIIATGYVRTKFFDVEQSITSGPVTTLASVRHHLQRKLLSASDGLSVQGVILALTVGDRSLIQSNHWDTFIETGTNHLLAISGLHISLVAGFVALLVSSIWRLVTLVRPMTISGSKQTCSLIAALMAAVCYSAMAGFTVPTVRALTMFTVLVLLIMRRRHQRRAQSLSIAAIVVCVSDPLSVLAPGFWMSFAAVAVLYLVFSDSGKSGRLVAFQRLLRGHVLVSIGLYPLTILFFQQASLISPVANLLVTPIVGILITPMVFFAAVVAFVSEPLAAIVLTLANGLLEFVLSVLGFLSTWSWALIKVTGFTVSGILFGSLVALVLLVPVTGIVRLTSLVLLLPLVFPTSLQLEPGTYSVTFLDVGQGTAVVVRTRNHVLVYDTGDQFSQNFSAANAVLIPFLHTQDINSIDRLIVSHADRDHSGGADELLDQMNVNLLMSSSPLPQRPDAPYVICEAGMRWNWDDVSFSILHPKANGSGSKNDMSCVLKISNSSGFDTLLPGDIESQGERSLVASGLADATSDSGRIEILMSPHHGSKTSSGQDFIDAVGADYVVHSAGYQNRFGFPRPEVVQRYAQSGAQQYTTNRSGAIEFMVSPDAINIAEYRVSNRRWWHRN